MAQEVIWYSTIWDELETPSNVIDYHITKEQTKDAFNVANANNQTTTGMANVIPWVNSPKLLYDTSIIWGWWSLLISWAEYWISTLPWTSLTKYDLENFTSWWDLYEDWWNIHCDWGTYLITLSATISNSSVTSSRFALRLYDSDWYVWYIAQWGWWRYVGGSTVWTFVSWNYIQLWVELDYSTSNTDINVNFVKLA